MRTWETLLKVVDLVGSMEIAGLVDSVDSDDGDQVGLD